ncbi:MAG: alpha-amylase family glycosyl hydrolase [Victivallaceae bacterium]|nr:alpha-amylase family glycosyl hydrolase [Victivallaceae bacterium]
MRTGEEMGKYAPRYLRFGQDLYLTPYRATIAERNLRRQKKAAELTQGTGELTEFANAHEYYGFHKTPEHWIFREYAPNATEIFLVGDFSDWKILEQFRLTRVNAHGDWQIVLPRNGLCHGMHCKLLIRWPGGSGERIPAYARYVTQDESTKLFSAEIWDPEEPYCFRHSSPAIAGGALVYEAHIGMAQEAPKVGSFDEFRQNILPRIVKSGYNTLQLMAIMNHPYYGSFGYHVASYYSIAGRFGTPDQFKRLVDEAHAAGLRVVIDLVHSHSVKNEAEGLGKFDGTRSLYFHAGERGEHKLWDSLLFDYGKNEVLHFLLSNLKFYLDEYHVDGFRFDGVTSMLYQHHGCNKVFSGYGEYFNSEVDEDALCYLGLANDLVHQTRPDAITIAEDVSGMPGLAAPTREGGIGFDYRLAMGVSDMWFKLFDVADEHWDMWYLWHELTNRRQDEKTISYVECHDQAIVGGQTAIFRLIGAAMYEAMTVGGCNPAVERGVKLHKLARLATAATADAGYLNFMGNEFGHPEWIDFPREGNQWSYSYARRQWSLADKGFLYYHGLNEFDKVMLSIVGAPGFYEAKVHPAVIDDSNKHLVFERNGHWFFFNFHPTQDWRGEVEVFDGVYALALRTDDPKFGEKECCLWSGRSERRENGSFLKLLIPPRMALVLRRMN